MRALALYAQSRSIPAALVVLPVVVLVAWSALHEPWTPLSASLTTLAAVVVTTAGLASQDPELDRSTAVPWPWWRLSHLLLAAATAAASVQLVQRLGDQPFPVSFVLRDTAGMIGLAGLAATIAGARLAAAAPVLWWAVAAIMPPAGSTLGRIVTWPVGAADDSAAAWTAGVLFTGGVAVYGARGGGRG